MEHVENALNVLKMFQEYPPSTYWIKFVLPSTYWVKNTHNILEMVQKVLLPSTYWIKNALNLLEMIQIFPFFYVSDKKKFI